MIILGDMHIGARKSSPVFHQYFKDSLEQMFDYMEDNNIKHILQVGDMFDVPSHLTTYAHRFIKENFLDVIVERDMYLLVLVGNHDIYYRDRTSLNTISEVIDPYGMPDRFKVVVRPSDVVFGDVPLAVFPWICKETEKEVESLLKTTKSKVAVGHFEFMGFEYHRGSLSTSGHVHTDYQKFDKVISGHYHTKSVRDNIHYTGTPYELTWVDYDDPKGFWDFNGTDMKFIQNEISMFNVWQYPQEFKKSDIQGKIHRIRVDSQSSRTKEFLAYKEQMMSMNPAEDIKVIEEFVEEETIISESIVQKRTQLDYVDDYIKTNNISDPEAVAEEFRDIFDQLGQYHDII